MKWKVGSTYDISFTTAIISVIHLFIPSQISKSIVWITLEANLQELSWDPPDLFLNPTMNNKAFTKIKDFLQKLRKKLF